MATTKQAKISDLVPDDRNFNKHSEYGMSLLEKSVTSWQPSAPGRKKVGDSLIYI